MTYYHSQVLKFRELYTPNDHIMGQIIMGKNFMDENFCEDINISQVASCSCFSMYHFIRLFKNSYGITPLQYIREKRMAMAMQLLDNGVSVTETCFRIGFLSQPSFSILFKKYSGKSPADYKNSNFQYGQSL